MKIGPTCITDMAINLSLKYFLHWSSISRAPSLIVWWDLICSYRQYNYNVWCVIVLSQYILILICLSCVHLCIHMWYDTHLLDIINSVFNEWITSHMWAIDPTPNGRVCKYIWKFSSLNFKLRLIAMKCDTLSTAS